MPFPRRSLLVGLVASSLGAARAGDDRLVDDLRAMAAPRIDRKDALGIVIATWRDGVSSVIGLGRPSPGDPVAPDGATLFEIGSITKVFTAIALAELAREGLVRLDDPVASLLPAGTKVPEFPGRPITLRMLADHTSGLPRIIPKVAGRSLAGLDPYAGVGERDVYEFLATHPLARRPGESYSYSNLGAGLLGTALARRAGTSYEDLVVGRICRPLGMADTRVTPDPARARRVAAPTRKGGAPARPWSFDALAGAGALRSTADDLLIFAAAQVDDRRSPPLLRLAMEDARRPSTEAGGGLRVGLGWHIVPARPGPDPRGELIWHNGGTGGFRSFLAIEPARRAAIVVLANSDDEVDTLALTALARLTRDPPTAPPTPTRPAQPAAPIGRPPGPNASRAQSTNSNTDSGCPP